MDAELALSGNTRKRLGIRTKLVWAESHDKANLWPEAWPATAQEEKPPCWRHQRGKEFVLLISPNLLVFLPNLKEPPPLVTDRALVTSKADLSVCLTLHRTFSVWFLGWMDRFRVGLVIILFWVMLCGGRWAYATFLTPARMHYFLPLLQHLPLIWGLVTAQLWSVVNCSYRHKEKQQLSLYSQHALRPRPDSPPLGKYPPSFCAPASLRASARLSPGPPQIPGRDPQGTRKLLS